MTMTVEHDPSRAAALLAHGGVIVYPTETLYGLGVDARDDRAVARLRALKQRDAGKPFPVLLPGVELLHDLGASTPPALLRLADAFWPGGLTIVTPVARPLMGFATIGFRVSAHPWVQALQALAPQPLVSTSANIAGDTPCLTLAELPPALHHGVDALFDSPPAPHGTPSTVVALRDDRVILLRAGAITTAELEAVIGGEVVR